MGKSGDEEDNSSSSLSSSISSPRSSPSSLPLHVSLSSSLLSSSVSSSALYHSCVGKFIIFVIFILHPPPRLFAEVAASTKLTACSHKKKKTQPHPPCPELTCPHGIRHKIIKERKKIKTLRRTCPSPIFQVTFMGLDPNNHFNKVLIRVSSSRVSKIQRPKGKSVFIISRTV